MWLNIFAFIFAFVYTCRANECDDCKANLNTLKTIFESSEADLDTLAGSLCFKEPKCANSVKAYLKQAKKVYSEQTVDLNVVCKPTCEESIGLGAKANLAIMSVLSNILNLVQTRKDKWKAAFCTHCPNELQPFADFFSRNEGALSGKIDRTCHALKNAGIATSGCHDFLKGLLKRAQQNDSPICPLMCKKFADNIADTTNRDKLKEIKARDAEMKDEVSEKLAKVDEVIQDNEETMPYVLSSSDGDVNAFCALCITFTSKLSQFEKTIVDVLSKMIAEIMFDDEAIKEHDLVNKLGKGIGDSFAKFVAKYKNPEMCKSQPIMACSSYTYDIVEAKLKQQDAKQLECDSCQTFLSHVAPILQKNNARKHLSDYLFKEIVNIFAPSLFDNLTFDVHSLITSAIEKLTQLVTDDKNTCSKTTSCAK